MTEQGLLRQRFRTEFTIRELLKLAIVKSDNAAFQMLKDLCDYSDFEEFLLQNGVIHSECRRQYGTKICAQDAIAYGKSYMTIFQRTASRHKNLRITS